MKTRFLTYLAFLGIISGCEGMLDKYPLAQMSPETFFSTENELEAFSNTFYTIFPSTSIYSENADSYTQLELPDVLAYLLLQCYARHPSNHYQVSNLP